MKSLLYKLGLLFVTFQVTFCHKLVGKQARKMFKGEKWLIQIKQNFMRVTIEFIEANKMIIEKLEYFLLLISIYYF